MLTRVFWLLEERTRHSLKPLLNQFLFPAPSTFIRLDYRLRRATLYPAELWVPATAIAVTALGCNAKSAEKFVTKLQCRNQSIHLCRGVIQPERGPAGCADAKLLHQGHGAMRARAHRDAALVQNG